MPFWYLVDIRGAIMSDTPLLGRPVWYELLTTDLAAAEAFYTAVVGWTSSEFPGLPYEYKVWNKAGDVPIGGAMLRPAGMNVPTHWVMYVAVPRLEDAVTMIERLGGKVLSPVIEIPNVGRLRTMLDPQGAMFAIHQPASPITDPETEPQQGDVAWRELYTSDGAAAMQFYSEVFGWRETGRMDMGPMGTYFMFGRAFPLGGIMTKVDDMVSLPTAWGLYFRVPDVATAAGLVKTHGGSVLNGPMEVPGGNQIAQCMDPQGAMFSLHQITP
jgi:uncharacterized protein